MDQAVPSLSGVLNPEHGFSRCGGDTEHSAWGQRKQDTSGAATVIIRHHPDLAPAWGQWGGGRGAAPSWNRVSEDMPEQLRGIGVPMRPSSWWSHIWRPAPTFLYSQAVILASAERLRWGCGKSLLGSHVQPVCP